MDRVTFESYGDVLKDSQQKMREIASKHDWKTVATWKHGTVMAILRCRDQLNISLVEAKKMVDVFITSGTAQLVGEKSETLDNSAAT